MPDILIALLILADDQKRLMQGKITYTSSPHMVSPSFPPLLSRHATCVTTVISVHPCTCLCCPILLLTVSALCFSPPLSL